MVQELIFEYFCRPIVDPTVQGYNFVNTAVYALILFALVWYIVLPFLKKYTIEINLRFALAILPYILFGSSLRVLTDMGFFTKTCNPLDFSFFTFTPGIWFLTAALAFAGIIAAKKLAHNENEFDRYFALIGLAFSLPILFYEITLFTEWHGVAMVIALVAAIVFTTKFLVNIKHPEMFRDNLNLLVVAGQVLDGSATFVATDVFTCGEQHPLSASILSVHPALFIVVKVIIALLIIHAVDSDVKDQNFRNFIKIAVIILGFATGTRDLLTLAVGTCS